MKAIALRISSVLERSIGGRMDRINYAYRDATIDRPWNDYVIGAYVNGSSVQATESAI